MNFYKNWRSHKIKHQIIIIIIIKKANIGSIINYDLKFSFYECEWLCE